MTTPKQDKIRNIAIIAHVDHGKTTMVDQIFKQAGTMIKGEVTERAMDSNELERERGITILAKNTGIAYGDYAINIVDTPGHSDFGGEVERTLQMVEGFLLLVDAAEGVLPGTRFVLRKALELNLKPIVVINKIDRKDAAIEQTERAIHDLFLDLALDHEQLEFPILYGSSRNGYVNTDPSLRSGDLKPLLDAIIKYIPAPRAKEEHLQFLVTNLTRSDFLGPIAIGRIFSGSMAVGQQIISCKDGVVSKPMKLTKMYRFNGLDREEISEAPCGDIVAVAGFTEAPTIGTTICDAGFPLPHPYVSIDEPTLSMFFGVNDSPFNGREGKLLTSRHIGARLQKELDTNVALRMEPTDSADVFKVSGRGQLHLSVLIETMRREGFELLLSAPQVIYKTIDGEQCEPMESLILDVPDEYQGTVMESMGKRKAELKNMSPSTEGHTKLEYEVPSRALLGFRSQYLTDTRGGGTINCIFIGYQPYKGEIATRTRGALVAIETSTVTAYALDTLQERGTLFVKPGDQVYEGQIVGENSRDNDMDVNPCKLKKLSNMRASGSDDSPQLAPPRIMDLEKCMEWIRPDEMIEVTPKSIRLRKRILKAVYRKRQ